MSDTQSTAAAAVDSGRLQDHLAASGVHLVGPVRVDLISGGKSNVTCRVTDGVSRWILRRPPLGDFAAGAHDVRREFKVMAALAPTQVPVPTVLLECGDPSVLGAPFYLMQEVVGRVIRTPGDLDDTTPGTRHEVGVQLVRGLADLHEVDFVDVGLGMLRRPGNYLERQVSRWARQMEAVQQRDLAHVATLVDILQTNFPDSAETTIVHGDYRLDNVIIDVDPMPALRAILDWEMATIGDPLADLATLLMFWDVPDRPFNPISLGLMAQPGFPSPEHAISIYRERRDVKLGAFDWYLVFAQFRLSVILEQIRVRHESGETLGDGFDQLAPAVDSLLEAAYEQARASTSLTTHAP